MATIFDNLRELGSPELVSALSRQTGESESAVSKGFGAVIPAIASTIASRADDTGFMKTVADLATNLAAAPHPLETVGTLVSPAGLDTSTTTGRWLSGLFGNHLSDMTDSIAKYAGLRGSSAASLLSIGAPLVLGYIGRLMRSDNLSVSGLADFFRRNQSDIAAALPAGIQLPESIVAAPHAVARTAADEISRTGWSVPIALLAALGIGGLIWWSASKPAEVARVNIVEPGEKTIGTAGTAAGKFVRSLPGNMTITIPAVGSAEDRLSMYLATAQPGTATINFDRIRFDSDSATLTDISNEQIANVATILSAYPRANVTVAGYTDSVGRGAENLALSQARADAVAARLKAAGVPPERVHAEGYGSQKPIADDSTEIGRAQNRRVELHVDVR